MCNVYDVTHVPDPSVRLEGVCCETAAPAHARAHEEFANKEGTKNSRGMLAVLAGKFKTERRAAANVWL